MKKLNTKRKQDTKKQPTIKYANTKHVRTQGNREVYETVCRST